MGKKTKIVLDTNVIVSAFGWRGKPEEVVDLVSQGIVKNFISPEMFNEIRRVISYPKLGFSETRQALIMETIFDISSVVDVSLTLDVVKDDPTDNRVLECAVVADVDFFVSGDKHLLNIEVYKGIKIITPEEFIKKRESH